jgi:hypothetical protein
MLEYWYQDRRTLVDFRRGPLGPYFDGFAASLKAKGYSRSNAVGFLSKCCQFNAFLIERGIARCRQLPEPFLEPFLDAYHSHVVAAGSKYAPPGDARRALNHLFAYLVQERGFRRPRIRPVIKPHTWVLEPYLRYLEREREISARNIKYRHRPPGGGGRWFNVQAVDEMASRGISGRTIAKTVGVSEATVRRILRGSRVNATKNASQTVPVPVPCV